jgi:uncharacterized protein (DUF305 family)
VKSSSRPLGAAALLVALGLAACTSAIRQTGDAGDPTRSPAAQAKADGGRGPYTAADVKFMQGMIHHHAQALTMAALAPKNGARGDVRILAERIDVAQRDEIEFMQRWLRERGETVPNPAALHDMAGHQMPMSEMPGMTMMMPGMLSPEQLAELKAATGPDFDRLFLTFMIQHHEGAITMVNELFGTPGAGQELNVWKFASDVEADQGSEIARMRTMLSPSGGGR